MASSPSDVHTLNMASSPSNVRTLIVDGFPPQEELSKLYLCVQFLLDEDQIADFIGMTDDSHAIILHGSSYLSTAMELIDGDIYQGCTLVDQLHQRNKVYYLDINQKQKSQLQMILGLI